MQTNERSEIFLNEKNANEKERNFTYVGHAVFTE